jgi:hypothetical protein
LLPVLQLAAALERRGEGERDGEREREREGEREGEGEVNLYPQVCILVVFTRVIRRKYM